MLPFFARQKSRTLSLHALPDNSNEEKWQLSLHALFKQSISRLDLYPAQLGKKEIQLTGPETLLALCLGHRQADPICIERTADKWALGLAGSAQAGLDPPDSSPDDGAPREEINNPCG